MLEWQEGLFWCGPVISCDICFEPIIQPIDATAILLESSIRNILTVHDACLPDARRIWESRNEVQIMTMPHFLWLLLQNTGSKSWLNYAVRPRDQWLPTLCLLVGYLSGSA